MPGWGVTVRKGEETVGHATTDSDGRWAVCGLPTGCYTALEENRPCWTATTPESQEVMLSAVKDAEGVDFGNREMDPCDPEPCAEPDPCTCPGVDGPWVPEPEVFTDQGCGRNGATISTVTFSGIACGVGPYTCEGPGQSVEDPEPSVDCAFIGVGAGPQTYVITDANGQSTEVEVEVEFQIAVLSTTVEQPTEGFCDDGSITVAIQSDSDALSVRWQKDGQDIPLPEPPLSASGLGPGEYSILVTDENGCYVQANATLDCGCPSPDDPNVTYISQDPAECEDWDGVCGALPFFADELRPFDSGCGCGCIRTVGTFAQPLPRFQVLGSFAGGGSAFAGDALEVAADEGSGWSLGVELGSWPRFGLELGALELPGLETVLLAGEGSGRSSSELRLLYASLHWRPVFLERWNLYLGPFVGAADLAVPSEVGVSEDPALGAVLGADLALGRSGRFTLSTSVRWLSLGVEVEDRRTGLATETELEPWILGLGVGYRF